ncbi:Unknown protein sequence [Pseudomonas savastanoi pv. glycinea]|uniref:Uncharacterized protein n=1 Tax=Pseudomonas savastanoi pv. glycinea TaxID=318 RepID=A0ABR5LAX4_PSESG|nr:Unknown protein sequence [Pseudomonas savastanoi pv. glycinea]KPC31981.1 Unknown protein sequence [Pseudomonas savastanoi pv. glycinea]KPC43033.1 Unknown protein sequence [Pseudomonas savastanoi pv. glycinea]KPC43756.1 Unknown protein sequence [Pseudomonas savastanoi pv. glycinea]RMU58399.1 hypothetical protein ALP27_102180 [Pseudomonas savastanoi pv. glycinea]
MYHPPARPHTAIKVVGASLLAKGFVQPKKMVVSNADRRPGHSHRIQQ